MQVAGVKVVGTLIRIECIRSLIIAGFILASVSSHVLAWACITGSYQSPEIVPHFRDVRIKANCPGVRVKGIAVLINLVIEDADRAPECGIAAIPVNSLLICFICFGILLLRHVATPQKIPALCVGVV